MKKEITSFCNIEKEIKDKLKKLKISCTLSIVLAPQKLKEHDRKILSNYQEIKSGDSFNYFNVNNNIATHGTDIEFHPLSDPANFNSADAALKDIKTIINEIRNRSDSEKRIFGNLTNKLIN